MSIAHALDEQDDQRLEFILEAQEHCDHFLTPIADPAGKSVLVVGCGAGTEMLWCLRRGAREVVGIDKAPQSAAALAAALRRLDLRPQGRWSIHRLAVEEADRLDRRFDLVLSNNVLEHVGDLRRALAVCARLVTPLTGRVALFTDPLFYSSAGSHLPLRPWEHLWGEDWEVRRRLLIQGELSPAHPLHRMSLERYMSDEITLNRMRLSDFLAAVAASDLVLLNLRLVRDRNLDQLGLYLKRLREARDDLSVTDLSVEGIAAELMRIEPGRALHPEAGLSVEEERWRHSPETAPRLPTALLRPTRLQWLRQRASSRSPRSDEAGGSDRGEGRGLPSPAAGRGALP